MNMKLKVPLMTITLAATLTAVANAQTLGTAGAYDILVLNGGEISMKDGGYGGQIGIGQESKGGFEDSAIFSGNLYSHSTVDYSAKAGFDTPNNNIFLSGFDTELEQAVTDAKKYADDLSALGATASFGAYSGKDSGPFSFSASMNQTVLDFTKLIMEDSNSFTLTGRGGFNDKFIIRVAEDVLFDQSDVILENLDHRDVVWYKMGNKDFDLHKAGFSKFQGTILALEGQVILGEVDFTGSVIATELKLGSGAEFTGQSTMVPEPSSSLLLLGSLGGLMFLRRRQS